MESMVYVHVRATFIRLYGTIATKQNCDFGSLICEFNTLGIGFFNSCTSERIILQNVYSMGVKNIKIFYTSGFRIRPNFLTSLLVFIQTSLLGSLTLPRRKAWFPYSLCGSLSVSVGH